MELHGMDNSELMDLLAKYTSDYTKMLSERTSNEEYERCKIAIKALQAEIDLRKNVAGIAGGTSATPPPEFS